jgi:hypothetical protein
MPGKPMTPWLVADKEPEAAYGCGTAGGWQIIRHSSRARLTPANRLNTQRQTDLGSVLQNRVVERNFQLGCGRSLLRSATRNPNCWMVLCCKA